MKAAVLFRYVGMPQQTVRPREYVVQLLLNDSTRGKIPQKDRNTVDPRSEEHDEARRCEEEPGVDREP